MRRIHSILVYERVQRSVTLVPTFVLSRLSSRARGIILGAKRELGSRIEISTKRTGEPPPGKTGTRPSNLLPDRWCFVLTVLFFCVHTLLRREGERKTRDNSLAPYSRLFSPSRACCPLPALGLGAAEKWGALAVQSRRKRHGARVFPANSPVEQRATRIA